MTCPAAFDAFSADRYEFANGRKPRGEGSWAFRVVWAMAVGKPAVETVWATGSYGAAKKEAMDRARNFAPKGAVRAEVSVCS